MKKRFFAFLVGITLCQASAISTPKKIQIALIVGSTRQERISDKIAHTFKNMVEAKPEITLHLIDLRDYALPFFNDAVPPAARTIITDPLLQNWSDIIAAADAFIFIVPEYNAGYPGVLKNALDSLYAEWNNKPVGFIGHSGGPSGGANAVRQLQEVTRALKMNPIICNIHIPYAKRRIDTMGNFKRDNLEKEIFTFIDELITQAQKSKKSTS